MDIDDVLDARTNDNEKIFRNFIKDLSLSGIRATNFEAAVMSIPTGSAFKKGDLNPTRAELYAALSDSEKAQLREHYLTKLYVAEKKFRILRSNFRSNFDRDAISENMQETS